MAYDYTKWSGGYRVWACTVDFPTNVKDFISLNEQRKAVTTKNQVAYIPLGGTERCGGRIVY